MTTQRQEADQVRTLSGVFDGKTTGTPIQLMIENTDQRSRDYGEIAQAFRPGHADITYHQKYGIRDYRGGGRSSARETASSGRSSLPCPSGRSAGIAASPRTPAPRNRRNSSVSAWSA